MTVASAQGQRSNKSSFPYSAAKGGLLALTRSMAVEYAPRIRANAIIPGQIESVRTEPYFNSFRDPVEAKRRVLSTFPMGRLGKPDDIAKAILFLASSDASWIRNWSRSASFSGTIPTIPTRTRSWRWMVKQSPTLKWIAIC